MEYTKEYRTQMLERCFISWLVSNLFNSYSLNGLYDFINRLIATLIIIFVAMVILTGKGQGVVVLKPTK